MKEDKTIISNLINELERCGFSKTVDTINGYSPDADLYYRKVDNQKYLVFNHYNKKRKVEFQGFDCWISTYKSENEIGRIKTIKKNNIQYCFQVDRDWHLIAQYL